MPVGGENLIVGPYTVTWNSVSLGLFVGEEGVPAITQIPRSTPVNRTNRYGGTKVDSVHMGFDYVFEAVLYEALLGMNALTMGWTFGQLGTIGALKYGRAQALVLTAVAGTPAAASPASITAGKAVLSDDHQGKLLYGPMIRTVPLKLDLLPYDLGGGTYGSLAQA